MGKSLWSKSTPGVGLRVCLMLKSRLSSVVAVIAQGESKLCVYILGTAYVDINTSHIIGVHIFLKNGWIN